MQTMIGKISLAGGGSPHAAAAHPASRARSMLASVLQTALSIPGDQTVAELLRPAAHPEQDAEADGRRSPGAALMEKARARFSSLWRRLGRHG
jgi:CelD/BcsL family acetyltransferase involved in cellulose biosynthesis